MNKLFLLLFIWLYPVASFSLVNEYKTDIYYGNGILTADLDAREATALLLESIETLYSSEIEMKKHIGKVDYAYNSTHGWGIGDLIESLLQKLSVASLVDMASIISDMANIYNILTENAHATDLDLQVEKYKTSIKNGHKVLVVAHSQGNLFAYEAYRLLPDWMQDYWEAVGVASPGMFEIKKDAPVISWDNDLVADLAVNPFRERVYCPVRRVYWDPQRDAIGLDLREAKPNDNYVYSNQLDKVYKEDWKAVEGIFEKFDFVVHGFSFYMGEDLADGKKINPFDQKTLQTDKAKILIMKAVKTKLDNLKKVESQWKKVKNIGCVCKDKRIQVRHKHDPSLNFLIPHSKDDYPYYYDYGNLLDFDSNGKIYSVRINDGATWTYVRGLQDGINIQTKVEDSPCYVLEASDRSIINEIIGPMECETDPDPDDNTTDPTDGCWAGVGPIMEPCDENQTCVNGKLSNGTPCKSCIDGINSYGQSCDNNETEPKCKDMENNATLPDGLFTAALGWGNHYVDIDLSNGLMEDKIQGCGYVALSSGDLTLHHVYPGIYPVNASASGADALDENVTDTVVFELKVIDTYAGRSFPMRKNYDYDKIGHLADIVITRPDPLDEPTLEIIPTIYTSSGGYRMYGGGGSSSHYPWSGGQDIIGGNHLTVPVIQENPPLCENLYSCGCTPCAYGAMLYLNQSRLGPISGATVKLYKAIEEDDANREILYSGKTSISSEIDKAGIISLPVPNPKATTLTGEEQSLMDAIANYEGDFVLEMSGGVDIDRDDDFNVDDTFTQVGGKLHLILSKEKLLQNDYKVNILTEIGYQLSRDLLGENYDKARLQARLGDIAKHVLIEKLYPDANQPLGRNDLFYWVPMAHKNWLVKPYDTTLAPIVNKVYAGENIYDEAYNYVYNPLPELLATVPVVKSQWFKVDENVTSGTQIGKIVLLSEGNSSVESYALSGAGSEEFRVDETGVVYLEENATLDYEKTAIYQLQLRVSNSAGESRPVTLYITVNNILDVPEDRSFSGGIIAEDAVAGDVAGVMTFAPGASPLERIEIGGTNASDFTVDLNGTIRVSDTANFDYETSPSAKITLQAFNSLGGSRVVPVHFAITDAVDVPIVQMLDVHLDENASSGQVVGKVGILTNDPLLSITLLGDGKENFNIDLNGTVTVVSTATLDYETRANYVLQVEATNIQGTSRAGTLVIRIDNVADVPQLKRTELRIFEGSSIGTEIGRVIVETNGSSPVTDFTLIGEGSENFEVDTQGIIRVNNASLSRSDQEFFDLYAIASNAQGGSLRVRVVIYIDTQRPILGILDSYIYEDTSSGTLIGTVPLASSATPISAIRLEGIGSEKFTVDLQRNVKLADGAMIDYESQTRYNLSVIATNEAGQSDSVPLYIRVVDKADTLKITGFSTTIYEDIQADTTIGFISVRSFGGKSIDHYELSGRGSENFSVSLDGTVTIKPGALFSAGQMPKYHLSAVAIDTEGLRSNEVYLDISVVESIDTIPQISDLSISVKEDQYVGAILGKTSIVSKTRVVEQAWLQGEGSELFELTADGAIVLKQSLDYEVKQSYSLSMYASNALGQSSAASLIVTVENVIDDEPILNGATFSVQENSIANIILGKVEVQSIGSSDITDIRLSGIGAEKFSIDLNGTVRLLEPLDYESKKVYHLQAVATNDKADSPEVSVMVNVENVPEHVPVLYAFKGFVEDNATAGTVVGTVSFASRGDSPIDGFVLEGTGKENFIIDTNGTIRVSATASLDETLQKTYTLQVRASNVSGSSDLVEAIIVLTYDKTIPYRPSNLKILDIGHNNITLGWVDNSENERGFNLYQDGVKIATLSPDTTSYRVIGLTEETSYIFALKSFNDRGESSSITIEGITDMDRTEYLKAILGQKCGVSASTFDRYFNSDTGYYNYEINCRSRGLTDNDLMNFKALKSVRYGLYLDRNSLTNVDGLSNLKSVGGHFYLYSNQLTNVDGLNKLGSVSSDFRLDANRLTNVNGLNSLRSVGRHFYLNNNLLTNVNGLNALISIGQYFYLQDNQLTNVDGLSALTTVGSHFYLHRNQITNIDGLNVLIRVGGNFNLENNKLSNLNSLNSLTSLDGYLALRGNIDLIDISGAENIVGKYGQLLYINPDQYSVKADGNSSLCGAIWDLRSPDGNIADDMNQVCEGQEEYVPEPKEQLRDILEAKCGISTSTFYSYFNADTGHYNYEINCRSRGLTDNDLLNFKALKSVRYGFYLDRNNLTNVDGFSNLKSVGGHFYLYNNQLTNVDGLGQLETVGTDLRLDGNQLESANLSSLRSVGRHLYLNNNQINNVNGLNALSSVGQYFYLQDNQLTNVDGLNLLSTVGSHFYLHRNLLTNIDGLSMLSRIGGNFNLEGNQLSHLNSLANLTSLGGYLALRGNVDLADISGAENIVGKYGQLLYINPDQYVVKADANSSMCSATWDLRSPDGNIPDDMNHVCEGQEPYIPEPKEQLRDVLEAKCSIPVSTFYTYFNSATGHYAYEINCRSKGLTDTDLGSFKALKSVKYGLYLDRNNLSNVDGLSNLKSVGGHFYLYNNQLTNVNGLGLLDTVGTDLRLDGNQLVSINLNSLRSVGRHLYLNNNSLSDVNGLGSLTNVGGVFYLQTNQLTNVNGLTNLTRVGSNLNVEANQLANLSGLENLTSLGGYLALRNNPGLIDISGIGNAQSSNGKLLYINPGQYTTKAAADSNFCSTVWDLRDPVGNIPDDMSLVCDLNNTQLTPEDKLRNTLGQKCGVSSETFYSYFNSDTGHYNYEINCRSRGLTDEDLLSFKALKSVRYGFYLDRNNLTNVDGLTNLKSVGGHFYLYNNQLSNVDGLGLLETVSSDLRLDGNQLMSANLNSLRSVGRHFYLNNNSLSDVNGLGTLTNVGGVLYLQTNQLTNINGLSNLTRVGSNLNVEGNQLTNLDGLVNLTSLGGYLALRNNPALTDISGVSNIVGSDGQVLYIAPAQYTVKADDNGSFCSATWDIKDSNGNITDDMTLVCDSVDPYIPSETDNLRKALSICGVSSETFYSYFNSDTGHYNYEINCRSRGLTDEDLLSFKALKSVRYGFYLDRNNLTNVDGLTNLKSVGGHFYLYNNQLSNVDGLGLLETVSSDLRLDGNQLMSANLNSLRSVGRHFYLNNNSLSDVNGLGTLTNVGGVLYLQTNQLTNINGLSNLTRVGSNLNVEGNQLTNLDGLVNLTSLGGYLALRNNPALTDISGVSNIVGSDGQVLYITQNQYDVKANQELKFCSTTWNLYDSNGDIADDMILVCGEGIGLTDVQELRAVMEQKCSVSYAQFANNFDEATGIYSTSLDCSYKQMNDEELMKFSIVHEIQGSLSINDNNLTHLNGLSNLITISGYFYLHNNNIMDTSGLNSLTSIGGIFDISRNMMSDIDGIMNLANVDGVVKVYHNANLVDIAGLGNVVGMDGKKIYIDPIVYSVKIPNSATLCSSVWDIYDTQSNIPDDMSKLCEGYNYVPTLSDKLRDILGKRCEIDSLTFYNSFAEDSGIYNGSIRCRGVTDEEMNNLEGLLEVNGNFMLEDSEVTTLDGLIRLKSVTGDLSIQNNTELTDINGVSNVRGFSDKKLIIDDLNQYDVKADSTKAFCSTAWDIYDGVNNIGDDMGKVCNP